MQFEQLTTGFQSALQNAHSLALSREHQVLEPAHVLAAMLDQSEGTVPNVLAIAGGNVESTRPTEQARLFPAGKRRIGPADAEPESARSSECH